MQKKGFGREPWELQFLHEHREKTKTPSIAGRGLFNAYERGVY